MEAIRAAASISDGPIIVWFPTISAQNFLAKSEYEVRPEWVQGSSYQPRSSRQTKGISLTRGGGLTEEVRGVLETIKELDLVLATGHVSWEEAERLVVESRKMGIQRMVITHPIYQLIDMPLPVQKRLANRGAFIEVCYSMFSIDDIPLKKIAEQIKSVGPQSCILGSDVGQLASPGPSESLLRFLTLLSQEGLDEDDFYRMLVTNPRSLVDPTS